MRYGDAGDANDDGGGLLTGIGEDGREGTDGIGDVSVGGEGMVFARVRRERKPADCPEETDEMEETDLREGAVVSVGILGRAAFGGGVGAADGGGEGRDECGGEGRGMLGGAPLGRLPEAERARPVLAVIVPFSIFCVDILATEGRLSADGVPGIMGGTGNGRSLSITESSDILKSSIALVPLAESFFWCCRPALLTDDRLPGLTGVSSGAPDGSESPVVGRLLLGLVDKLELAVFRSSLSRPGGVELDESVFLRGRVKRSAYLLRSSGGEIDTVNVGCWPSCCDCDGRGVVDRIPFSLAPDEVDSKERPRGDTLGGGCSVRSSVNGVSVGALWRSFEGEDEIFREDETSDLRGREGVK